MFSYTLPSGVTKKFKLIFSISQLSTTMLTLTVSISLCLLFTKPLDLQIQDTLHQELEWSSRKLTFADFHLNDNIRGPEAAYISGKINYSIITEKTPSSLTSLNLRVKNIIDPNNTWIRNKHLGDTAILSHEQGHFDLAEVYSRKFIASAGATPFSKNYKTELKKIYDSIHIELTQAQVNYDKETHHGLNIASQKKWLIYIKEALKSLDMYKTKFIHLKLNH